MGSTRFVRFLFILTLLAVNALVFIAFYRWSDQPGKLGGRLYGYELQLYDVLTKSFTAQPSIDPRIRIVGVDDSSIKVFGPFPWNRALYAQLLEVLERGEAAVASFDFLYDSLTDGTGPFAEALGSFKRGILACTVPQEALVGEKEILPVAELSKKAAGVGYINVDVHDMEYDPKIRRTALAEFRGGKWWYSWDLLTYALAQKVPVSEIKVEDRWVRVGSELIPTNENHELLINYYNETSTGDDSGFQFFALDQVPFWRMLGTPPPDDYVGSAIQPTKEQIKDGVFLVGFWASTITGDMVETPVGRKSGIWVHAQIVNTLLTRRWMREAPLWLDIVMLLGLPLLLAWVFMRVNAIFVFLGSAGVIVSLLCATIVTFEHGFWLRSLGPAVGIFLSALLVVLYQFFRSHMLLRQFITPELAHDLLLAEGDNARTTEEDCTIIFSDIRGFTTLNEQMSPTKMVELLKEYHSLTVPIYEKHGGRCLDYLGDAQMVVYGDPMTVRRAKEKNHAVGALTAALEVHDAIDAMNQRWQQRGDPPFEVGIGCCSGVVAIGVLGADTAHLQYTVIGDVTNTAARVQGLSRDLRAPVICTQSTVDHAGDRVVTELIQAVALKGKAKEVTVFRVLGPKDDPTTVERMRAQTREIVGTAMALALGVQLLLAAGCTAAPPASAPSSAAPSPAAAAPPTAGIQPVGTPIVVKTVVPSVAPQGAASPGGPRVVYATPPPPALPGAVSLPTPTSPLMAPSEAPGATPLLEGLTFPIYPQAVKKTQMSQDIPDAQHLIVVLISNDKADLVKAWYADKVKPSAVVDSGREEDGNRKIEMTRAGGRVGDAKLLDTIVIQPEADGTTQIVLAQWLKK